MIRGWILNIASAASLLLCVAIVAIWGHSQSDTESLHWARWTPIQNGFQARLLSVNQFQSSLSLCHERIDYASPDIAQIISQAMPDGFGAASIHVPNTLRMPDRFAFGPTRINTPQLQNVQWTVRAPAWLYLAATGALPAIWIFHRLRIRFRLRAATCDNCGDGLTTNTSGVCPECRTAVPKKPKAVT